MTAMNRDLIETIEQLPEGQARIVLDFIAFLRLRDEHHQWESIGAAAFAQGYGPDEPEYSEADIRPELDRMSPGHIVLIELPHLDGRRRS